MPVPNNMEKEKLLRMNMTRAIHDFNIFPSTYQLSCNTSKNGRTA